MQWAEFVAIYEQMHPKSFTMQKLNLINGLRRQFPYIEEEAKQELAKPKMARPMMKPKAQSSGKDQLTKPIMKPKMARPIIKPKPKKSTD